MSWAVSQSITRINKYRHKNVQLCCKCDLSSMIIQLPANIVGQYHDPLHKSIFKGIKMYDLCWKRDLSYDYISTGCC